MTDDQGWGQTGYYNHPVLETPNPDEKSIEGVDYPEGKLTDKPYRQGWMTDPRYRQYLDDWVKRPAYRDRIIKANNQYEN